jgi:16S rRNA (guanine527-N7)-methyltransferase
MNLSTEQINRELAPYLQSRFDGLADKINVYMDLLLRWNRKISLTTVTDLAEIVRFHFGESLFALRMLQNEKSRLADVGTGAGFPGLPLAMALPQLGVTLIESNAKKCAFLAEVIRTVDIKNASILRGRMESMSSDVPKFDFITARAFGHFDVLLPWARKHLAENGNALFWLGDADSRDVSSSNGWRWDAPSVIPGSSRRFLLTGTPAGP